MAMSPATQNRSGSRQPPRSPAAPRQAGVSDPMGGMSPEPKRPHSLADAPQAATRVMTNDQIISGLCEVHGLVVRDEEFSANLFDAVDTNAQVLMSVMNRVQALEAQIVQQDAVSAQLTADTVQLKAYVQEEDARIDGQLRLELSAMSKQLEEHNDQLMAKLAAFEASLQLPSTGQSTGVEPPGLAAVDGLRVSIAALEGAARTSAGKVDGLESGQQPCRQG